LKARIRPPGNAEIVILFVLARPAVAPNQRLTQWVTPSISPEVNWAEPEASLPLLSVPRSRIVQLCLHTHTPYTLIRYCLIIYVEDIFTFYLTSPVLKLKDSR
jgi:hypothetical protein